MKWFKASFAALFLLYFSLDTKAVSLSDSAQISLLTVAPGDELYAAFGHSGIRVQDFKQGFDVVFNYGTFDFDQPDFYLNFVRGYLLYMIDVSTFNSFMSMYVYEERSVTEDILNLSIEEKQHIFSFLANNALPENRNYRYEFFFDNCATRIRDVFKNELKEKIQFDYTGFDTTKTLRNMLDLYVSNSPWVQFGFYLILGLPCDIQATPEMQTFLPDYLQKTIQQASVKSTDGSKRFVSKSQVLLSYPPPQNSNEIFTPEACLILLLIIAILIYVIEIKTGKRFVFFDFLLFFIAGLLGCFFLSMWAFTEHYSVAKNLNVLWAIPLFLPCSFFLFFKKINRFNLKWLNFTWMYLPTLLAVQFVLPQPFHRAISIIIILLAFRAWASAKLLKRLILK